MTCGLCLEEITAEQEVVKVEDGYRHQECSNELEKALQELKTIYATSSLDD